MPSFRYRYSPGNPLIPSVLLNLAHPATSKQVSDVPAIIDTGADQSVIPEHLVDTLGLIQMYQRVVRGFDGKLLAVATYFVLVQVRDFDFIDLEVIASPTVENAIVGRDILNLYKVTLDGPGLLMTISDEA